MADLLAQIRRYNGGEMPDDERDEFELRMVRDAQLARDVEHDALLEQAVRDAVAANLPIVRESTRSSTVRPWSRQWYLPIAASMAVVAAVVGFAVGADSRNSYAQVVHADLTELRDATGQPAPTMTLSGARDALIVVELVALVGENQQSIEVFASDGSAVGRIDHVAARGGVLTAAFAPGGLAPGEYEIGAVSGAKRGARLRLKID